MRKINAKLLLGLLLGTLFATGGVFAVHHFQYGRIAESLLWQARRAEEDGQIRRQARYLQRYLEFNRKDLDVKERLAQLWAGEAFADSPRERLKAVRLLDDVLSQGDEKPALRRLLVKVALELRQFKLARNHLEKLLSRDFLNDPPDVAADSERKLDAERGEALGYAAQLLEAENQPAKALRCYYLAKRHAPRMQSNYLNLAFLLRKEERLDRGPSKASREADRVVDELVANNRESHESYLSRWRYRRDFGLINVQDDKANEQVSLRDAAGDVAEALRRAPESVDVLLAAADLERLQAQAAYTSSASPQERGEGRKAHRDKALAYLDQALTLHARKKQRSAIDMMRFRLLWHKANLLLDDVEWLETRSGEAAKNVAQRQTWEADVAKLIDEIRKTHGSAAGADFLKARLLFQDRRWAEAVTLFEQARPTLGSQPDMASQINRYLGQCYEQLADPGQMYRAYERLHQNDANSLTAQLGMAQAEWRMGHLDKAAETYQRLRADRRMPSKVYLDYTRLEIQRQALQERPDWRLVGQLLNDAAQANPAAVEVPLLRAQLCLVRADVAEARRLLQEAQREKGWRDSVELWTARIALELQDKPKNVKAARALLAEAKKKLGERVVLLRLVEANILAEEMPKAAETPINRLAEDVEQFPNEEERGRLLSGLADMQTSLDNRASARRLWQQVVQLPSRRTDLPLHLLLFDLASKAEDEAGMRQALDDIRGLEGNQGPFHRYGEALRLLAKARKEKDEQQKQTLDEASRHLERVQAIRPNWPPLFLARAQIERLTDQKDKAIGSLRLARENGDTNPAIVRELVELLAENGRFEEADAELKGLRSSLLVNSDLGRYATTFAVQGHDFERARKLFADNRADAGRNYRELLWQGRMLAEMNQPKDAEVKLRAAQKAAEHESEPYIALVQFLVRHKRDKEADAVLEQARQNLPAEQVELTLGLCYEILGRKESAKERYEEALNSHRQDAVVVRRVAAFYWSSNRMAETEPLLRDLLAKRVKNVTADDLNWARLHLALVLASGTDFGRFREALALVDLKLDNNGHLIRDPQRERLEGSDMRRFQARVLASQAGHRQFRQRARELLEELERNKALPPDDRFILGMLYETENAWSKAKPILMELADKKAPSPRHVTYYLQMLLEHKEIETAAKEMERLEALEEQFGAEANAFAAIELRARLLEEQREGDKAIALLERHIRRKKANPNEVLLVLNAMRRQKKFAQAYERCLQELRDRKCSPEVIGGASVAVLRGMQTDGTPPSHEQVLTVEQYLTAALEANPKNVILMLHLAELYDQHDHWEQAEQMYRRVLEPDNEPRNIVALDNLAWLLAQRSSDRRKHQEALTHIESAVNGIGRRADLIDTRGLVRMKLGQDAAALADFREAAADLPTPSHLFHLARAHYQARDKTNASKVLKQAQDQGLQASLLHPSEQSEYRKMLMELKVR
jgi:tetratricopeptide (TPR) repeat protein